ncbi:MAG TPA: hypothetical protein VNY55_08910 [Mycobacterium sp.]|nr:hypothetical protein [Mycobacterium sp.]
MRAGPDLAERHRLIEGPTIQDCDKPVEHAVRGRRAPASGLAELLGMLRGGAEGRVVRRKGRVLPARRQRLTIPASQR